MREKKKSLKLKKHVIANLRSFTITGGALTNPCRPEDTNTVPSEVCNTMNKNDYTCNDECNSITTRTNKATSPEYPCNDTVLNTGPDCP